MDFLEYRQKDGFTVYALDPDFDWKNGEVDHHWRLRLGYNEMRWGMGSDDEHSAEAYKTENQKLPRFMVEVCDSLGSEIVFVREPGDLFALRLRVAAVVIAQVASDVDTILELVRELRDLR